MSYYLVTRVDGEVELTEIPEDQVTPMPDGSYLIDVADE